MTSLRLSALEAYAQSFPAGQWEAPSPFLAAAIEIATRLQAATMLSGTERFAVLARCAADAREGLIESGLHPEFMLDSALDPGASTSLRALRLQVANRGHKPLAQHLIESLLEIWPPDTLEYGRTLDVLRLAAVIEGDSELEMAHTKRLLMVGRRLKSDELMFRAWHGAAYNALFRGNLPCFAKRITHGRKHAERTGDPRLLASMHDLFAILAGSRGDYPTALVHHWRAVATADHPFALANLSGNTAETLYRSGHFRAARAARAIALTHSRERSSLLVHLGGYAVCCAALGDIDGVQWAAGQTLKLSVNLQDNRGVVQGLLGIADACGQVGLTDIASDLYTRGMRIADAKGYHDLRFREDPTKSSRPEPVRLEGDAVEALQAILRLAPDGVSRDLELVAN